MEQERFPARETTHELPDLGSPRQVLSAMIARGLAWSLLGGTFLAAVFLFDLSRFLGFIVSAFCGWQIFFASYVTAERVSKRRLYIDMWWNHVILVAVLLFGGVWMGIVSVGTCAIPEWARLWLLPSLPPYCSESSSVIRAFITGAFVGTVFLGMVPGVLAFLYRRR